MPYETTFCGLPLMNHRGTAVRCGGWLGGVGLVLNRSSVSDVQHMIVAESLGNQVPNGNWWNAPLFNRVSINPAGLAPQGGAEGAAQMCADSVKRLVCRFSLSAGVNLNLSQWSLAREPRLNAGAEAAEATGILPRERKLHG